MFDKFKARDMYAIIAECGRQYRVEEGQELQVDYREAPAGQEITFEHVLVVSREGDTKIGQPTVAGAKVTAEVLGAEQGPKLVVQKMRRTKNSRRKTGHRQIHTRVRIRKIEG